MSKLILMQGLPASGKSTRAEEIVKKYGNCVRLNRDLLRTMLHFDKWSGRNERLTKDAQRELAIHFLKNQKVVIIDDTNLNPGTVESWKTLATSLDCTFEINRVETDFWECIGRDSVRVGRVGSHVIAQMARQYGLYPWDGNEVIVDIDGTIADTSHRKMYVTGENKEWDKFFAEMHMDEPRLDVLQKVDQMRKEADIILVSGRPEKYRAVTVHWLEKHGIHYKHLFMRRDDDSRPDTEVKKEILDKYFKKDLIKLVIDDRPSVIRMWRENGLEVMDVGTGEEF